MNGTLKRRYLLRAAAGIVASGIAGCFEEARNPGQPDTPSPTPEPEPMQPFDASHAGVFQSTDPIERGIHKRINKARRTRDIEPLSWDGNLAYIGRAHARDMHQRDFYAHENPDGEVPRDRMEKYGLDSYLRAVGENIAKRPLRDSTDDPDVIAREFFQMWKSSDGHWSNIRESSYGRHGVGVYIGEDKWMYAASMFGVANARSRN